MSSDLENIYLALREIKEELKHFDDKWENHIQLAATDRQKINQLCKQVDHIEQLLTRGNGQKPLVQRIQAIHADVERIKKDQEVLKDVSGLKTEEDLKLVEASVKKARWIAVAKLTGVLTLAMPGILALLGVGG